MICFFFQAEDGIRDLTVTGVQTCALPIWPELHDHGGARRFPSGTGALWPTAARPHPSCTGALVTATVRIPTPLRSEERRVGKECRTRPGPCPKKKKTTQRT